MKRLGSVLKWVVIGLTALVVATAISAIVRSPDQDAPTDIIGRWCDTPAGEVVIRQTDQGLLASVEVLKGALLETRVQRDGDAFVNVDSRHGDGFRVLASGDLELFDSQGHIRVASKARGACKSW